LIHTLLPVIPVYNGIQREAPFCIFPQRGKKESIRLDIITCPLRGKVGCKPGKGAKNSQVYETHSVYMIY